MKRFAAIFLSFVMVMGLAACGSQAPSSSQASSSQGSSAASSETASSEASSSEAASSEAASSEASSQAEPSQPEAQPEEGGTLVVYFSATGNTEEAAGYIAQLTGGDLFELEPADPYTSEDLNYGNADSRVSREHDDESLRDVALVADTVEGWDQYDTVFIGYPIWWGIAAWPVDAFIEANDFTGKTVIPFCTSASSGLGESGELLAEMAGTGDWLEGHRFSSNVSESDVQSWLDGLGL